jgi:hypothetical protein
MSIGTISEELKAFPDYMFNNAAVPKNTTLTGDAQQVGGTQGELELVAVIGDANVVITDTKIFTVSLTGAETADGSFTALATLFTVTASGATTLAAGTELGRYIVKPSDPMFAKAVATTNDAAATGTVTVYIRRVVR